MIMRYHRGSLKKHEAIKQQILRDPSLIGMDKSCIVDIKTEYALIKKKRPIAQPDLMIKYKDENSIKQIFVEVKSGSCKRAIQNLVSQMQKVERFLQKENINGNVIGVYCVGNDINMLTI